MARKARSETPADKQVNVRLTSAEYKALSSSAAAEGRSVSEYVRLRALSPRVTSEVLLNAQNDALATVGALAAALAKVERPDQVTAAVEAARKALAGQKEDG